MLLQLPPELLHLVLVLLPVAEAQRMARVHRTVCATVRSAAFAADSLRRHVANDGARHFVGGPTASDRAWLRWPPPLQRAYAARLRPHLIQMRWGLYFGAANQRLPAGIGGLLLTHLDLKGNGLIGPLLDELGGLVSAKVLDLSGNALEGCIPATFGNLKKLECLNLASNMLSGCIPNELGSLESLQQLDLSCNILTGSIPAEIGLCQKLWSLKLGTNELEGELPESLGQLIELEDLHLENNLFSGEIPPFLSSLRNLEQLNLSTNSFHGRIPAFLGKLVKLRILNLKNNKLEGKVTLSNLEGLSSLWKLELSGNQLDKEYLNKRMLKFPKHIQILLKECFSND